ncbi:MAG TPA: response regulator [Bryobacteraceae bacterium]|nr:response regulator [Bryobacteraceae bacterium]
MHEAESAPAKILVIEDNTADVLLLRHALDHQGEAYELQVLQDGAQAMAFVESQRTFSQEAAPCVMVLDMHLPKHDGLSILQALKRAPELLHIRVIALSSFVSPRDEEELRMLRVRLYREKPSDLDGWLALAREIFTICREPLESAASIA